MHIHRNVICRAGSELRPERPDDLPVIRTSVSLPTNLLWNGRLEAAIRGQTLSQFVQELATAHLKANGRQPDRMPREIQIVY